jgi:RNA-directed DNA polymerase
MAICKRKRTQPGRKFNEINSRIIKFTEGIPTGSKKRRQWRSKQHDRLGISTIIDRLIQPSIHEVLSVGYERIFSSQSYAFRLSKNAHQALKQAGANVAAGKGSVIDLDLEKLFDAVNHHRLIWLLSIRIIYKRVLQLIHHYLKAGMLQNGLNEQRIKGTPQCSPLSPLLSNIVDELDKELER